MFSLTFSFAYYVIKVQTLIKKRIISVGSGIFMILTYLLYNLIPVFNEGELVAFHFNTSMNKAGNCIHTILNNHSGKKNKSPLGFSPK